MTIRDRTQETTTSIGDGAIVLAGPKSKSRTFSSAYSVGDLVPYSIDHQTLDQWEVGFGRLLTTNTLSRLSVTASSNGGRLVNFSAGSKNVSAVLNAAKFNNLGSLQSVYGAQKWFGACLNNLTVGQPIANASTYRATYGLTMVAEAPFYAVQLVYINNVNNAMSGMKALVGVTETIVVDSTKNAKPVIGGVTYGQLAPAGSVNGFRPVTWGGSSTLSIAASTTSIQVAISDVIPLSSVPRADVPGALPALVARLDHDPSTGGRFGFHLTPAGMRTATTANRGRVVISSNSGFDGVATPSTNLSASGECHMMFPIFHYAVPSKTVLIAGDSISQNDQLVADVYTSWGWRGCADASSPKAPINYMNMGASSKGSAEYWTRTQEVLNVIDIDVLVIGPASVNDGYTNLDRTFSDHRARALEILRVAKAKKIDHVIFIPMMPYNTLTSAQDAYRKDFNTWLGTLGVPVLNFSSLGDGATPERWVPSLNYNADGVHPNETCIDTIMAPELTAHLLQLG